jgi:hypothetical protein
MHDTIKIIQTGPVGGAIAPCLLFIGVLLRIRFDPVMDAVTPDGGMDDLNPCFQSS